MECIFCDIVAGRRNAYRVFEDETAVAFLDAKPLFPGHTLIVPREHYATLSDLPEAQTGAFFLRVRRVTTAVERAMEATGSFVALNNRVSQSVPHLHAHIVPRERGDGLRGFFWPRGRYADDAHAEEVAARLRAQLADDAPG